MGIGTALNNGVTGLNSFATAISVVSDNVANANTTAYKSNSVHFGDMVNSYYSIFSNDTEGEGTGSVILGFDTDYAQGMTLNTSNWSDLAISGEGFFTVKDTVSGKTHYTRDGGFNLDDQGYFVNPLGYRVQGYDTYDPTIDPTSGHPIGWDPTSVDDILVTNPQDYVSIRVDANGEVIGVLSNGSENRIARLELATFTNRDGLVRQGSNLYSAGPSIGQIFNNGDNPNLFGQVVDYSLEGSNVDLAKEMVDMIIYQASYNANSKTITTSSDMLDTSINMVR